MCLAQGPQPNDAGEAWTRDPSVSSQALYHWATALPKKFSSVYENPRNWIVNTMDSDNRKHFIRNYTVSENVNLVCMAQTIRFFLSFQTQGFLNIEFTILYHICLIQYMLDVFFVGHKQTVQTQIRCHWMWCLTRLFSVCLCEFHIKTK